MEMADKDVLYHELLEALQAGGCPLCRLARRASNSYLHALIYEGVTDVKVREELREARGLCYRHGWRLASQRGAVLGTAIIYRDVINTLVRTLEASETSPSRLFGRREGGLQRALAATQGCPACVLERDSEERTAKILLRHIDDDIVAAEYQRGSGLCLPHLEITLNHAGQAATRSLAAWQAATWGRLRDELDELIRKHDYRFRHEPVTEEESFSWERGVAGAVGEAEPGKNE
jgi:hypothetical protein